MRIARIRISHWLASRLRIAGNSILTLGTHETLSLLG